MENTTDNKLSFLDKLLQLLDKRFATAISSAVTGGVIIFGNYYFNVIPVYKDRINELIIQRDDWKKRYDDCPSEMNRFQKTLDDMKNSSLEKIEIKAEYQEKLDQQNREIEELKKPKTK